MKLSDEVINAQIRDFAKSYKKYKLKDKERKRLSCKQNFSKRLICLMNKKMAKFYDQSFSISQIYEAANHEHHKIEKISEELQSSLKSLLLQKKYRDKIGAAENTFCLYDEMISRITKKRQLACLALELAQVTVIVLVLGLVYLALKTPTAYSEYATLLILCSTYFPIIMGDICYYFRIKLADHIRLTRKQSMLVLLYDKLAISDQYFLAATDNVMINQLMYTQLGCFSTCTGLPWFQHIPVLLLGLGLMLAVLSLDRSIFHSHQLVFLISFLLPLLITRMEYALQKKKRVLDLKQKRLTYEIIYNFNSLQTSKLTVRCKTQLNFILEEKRKLEFKLCLCNSLLFLANSKFIPGIAIFSYYLVPAVFYPQIYLNPSTDRSVVENHFLWKSAPCFKHILGTILIFHLIKPFIDEFIRRLRAEYLAKDAKTMYDRFFENLLVIEPPPAEKEGSRKGSIMIEGCDVFERDPKGAEKVVNQILGTEHEETIETKISLSSHLKKENNKVKSETSSLGYILAFTKPTDLKNISKLKKQGKDPIRLRQLFTDLRIDISAGAKLCLFDKSKDATIKDFFRMLSGNCLIGNGQMFMNGTPFYFNPNNMCFIVNRTIQDNILFGREYVEEKYRNTLKTLNVTFNAYNGSDFYKVTENASNLKKEDKRMIMLARMIYSNSDIYIVEDYLNESATLLNLNLIQNIFKTVLREKTVIFNSNIYQFIDLSTQIIQFETREKMWVFMTGEFRNAYQTNKKVKRKLREDSRKQILRNKIKNSLFIKSTGFEEELAIHKMLESQKKEVEEFRKTSPNIVDQLIKGVLLVQRRRQKGENIEELGLNSSGLFTKMYLKKLWKTQKPAVIIFTLSMLLKITFFYLFEWFSLFSEDGQHGWDSRTFSRTRIIQILVFFLFFLINEGISNLAYRKANMHIVIHFQKMLLEKFMNLESRKVDCMRFHSVLERLNTDLDFFINNFIPEKKKQLEIIINITFCSCIMTIANSVVLPVVLVLVTFPFTNQPFEDLTKIHLKLLDFKDLINSKLASLNYQLLKLIPLYRLMKTTQKMDINFVNLCNNEAAIETVISQWIVDVTYKATQFVDVFSTLSFFIFLCIAFNIDSMNFVGTSVRFFVYAVFLSFRLHSCIRTLRYHMILTKESEVDILSKLYEFNKKLEENQKVVIKKTWKKLEFDGSCPIIFKNVSVTLGFIPILKKISFKVNPQDRFGIVGIEGSGRKTIFQVLTGSKKMDQDSISKVAIFGLELEEIEQSMLQEEVFLVEELPNLLAGTLKSNIDPYTKCEENEIVEIFKRFELSEFFYQESNQDLNLFELEPQVLLQAPETNLISERKSIIETPKTMPGNHNHLHRAYLEDDTPFAQANNVLNSISKNTFGHLKENIEQKKNSMTAIGGMQEGKTENQAEADRQVKSTTQPKTLLKEDSLRRETSSFIKLATLGQTICRHM